MDFAEAIRRSEQQLLDAAEAIDNPRNNRELAKVKAQIGQGFAILAILKLVELDHNAPSTES